MKKNENELLQQLLHVSNLSTKKSKFQKQAEKTVNSPIVQHHVNALIKELLPSSHRDNKKLNGLNINNKTRKAYNVNKKLPIITLNLRAPNIRANTDFSELTLFDKELDKPLTFFNTQSIDDYPGIEFDTELWQLSGNTEVVGDHEFDLYGVLALESGQHQRVHAKLKVTVVPDPRSLWKNIPSDETARFHKPDSHSLFLENKTVLLMGSSVRGRSHAHKGIHRDDDFKLFCDDTSDWNISCVADGAGSCKYSRQGSFVAATCATTTLKETLNGHYGEALELAYNAFHADKNEVTHQQLLVAYQHTIVKAVFEAAKAIRDCVDAEQGDVVKDFSTTLIIAAHKKVADGHLVLSFWIGDGGVVIYEENKRVILMGEPDSGEFAGQTRFLDNKIFDDASVYNRVRMEKVDSMTALILATDGITDAWFETEKQLDSIPKWDHLWGELALHVANVDRQEGLKGLTEWMDFWSKGNHDDRTISICTVKE